MKNYSIFIAFLSAALFGASTPASKVLLNSLPPFQLAGLLYLGAGIGVSPLILRDRNLQSPWQLERKNRYRLLGAIACGGILAPVFLLLGLKLASAASVSLWLNLEMVTTAVLGYFFFQDYLGRWGWFGVVGTVFAAILLSLGEGIAGIEAGLFVAMACFFWGIDNHLTALVDSISPAQSTFWKGLVAGTVNLTIGFTLQPVLISPSVLAGSLGVGALSYGVSMVLYITAAQGLGATRAQMIFSCAPFFGVVFSAFAIGETISLIQKIAVLIKFGSLLALIQDQHGHKHDHEIVFHNHLHSHDDGHHTHSHQGETVLLRHSHDHRALA